MSNDQIWSRCVREEIISVLWLIAGLLAWQDEMKWLAWFLFIRALADMITAIVFGVIEVKIMRQQLSNQEEERG